MLWFTLFLKWKWSRDTTKRKSVVAKLKHNVGEAYASLHKKNMPERARGPPCTCVFSAKGGDEHIKQIFKEFVAIGDYDKQNTYISNLVKVQEMKHPHLKERQSLKAWTMAYAVMCGDNRYSVCVVMHSTAFMGSVKGV